jgi:putative dimethyl sulfoxide reductase chaperone
MDRAQNDADSLARVAENLSDLYQILAIGFRDPTKELAVALLDGSLESDLVDCLQRAEIGGTDIDEALRLLRGLRADELAPRPESLLLHELKVEYARLFIGPRAPQVHPYESVYRDTPHGSGAAVLMVGPSALAVREAYRRVNGPGADDAAEPPDHVATELDFQMCLYYMEAQAWQSHDEAAAKGWRSVAEDFATGHLCRWGPELCRDVRAKSHHAFYGALARAAIAILAKEPGASCETAE